MLSPALTVGLNSGPLPLHPKQSNRRFSTWILPPSIPLRQRISKKELATHFTNVLGANAPTLAAAAIGDHLQEVLPNPDGDGTVLWNQDETGPVGLRGAMAAKSSWWPACRTALMVSVVLPSLGYLLHPNRWYIDLRIESVAAEEGHKFPTEWTFRRGAERVVFTG